MSRKALHATVMSQPPGSDGGSSSHAESARMSASCTASSAVAKSAPRWTRTLSTRGTSSRSSTPRMGGSVVEAMRCGQERPNLEPLVDGFTTGAGRGRQLAGELDRPLVAVDVDHHPTGDEVLRLRKRTVGDRRPSLAVVADPHAIGRHGLPVDELTGA